MAEVGLKSNNRSKVKKISFIKKEDGTVNLPITILLIICSLTILFPLYITIVIAFKQPSEMIGTILSLPKSWSFSNFKQAIEMTNFFHTIMNSLFITAGAVVVTIVTNSLVAYAIARNMHKKSFINLYIFIL